MAYRGRGHGRGFGGEGGGHSFAKQEPFPEDVVLPDAKVDNIDASTKKLLNWNNKLKNYWKASPYLLEDTNLKSSGGVCLMRNSWKEEQHPSFINFVSTFLSTNSFRLNVVPVAPDFIFNCGGLSVAFIFVTNWDNNNVSPIFNRIQKLKMQFARFYVVITLPAKEQIDSFFRSYFEFDMVIGKPTFVPVQDLEMGFEKMVKIAHSLGVCKQQRIGEKLKAERRQLVQGMDLYLKVVTSIPGIDNHDANALCQAIGSVQAIAKASKEQILENTDLSTDKAEIISRFFRDPKFYLSPKIN